MWLTRGQGCGGCVDHSGFGLAQRLQQNLEQVEHHVLLSKIHTLRWTYNHRCITHKAVTTRYTMCFGTQILNLLVVGISVGPKG